MRGTKTRLLQPNTAIFKIMRSLYINLRASAFECVRVRAIQKKYNALGEAKRT